MARALAGTANGKGPSQAKSKEGRLTARHAHAHVDGTGSAVLPDVIPPQELLAGDFTGPAASRTFAIAQAYAASKWERIHRHEQDRLFGVPDRLAALVTNDKADILASAYIPDDGFHTASPFDLLLGDDAPGRFIPPMADGDHAWLETALPAATFSDGDQACLATAIYFEARGESAEGQAAVAQVILNRVRNPAYPGTICGVVYQNSDWLNRCQFSFACDGTANLVREPEAYRRAEEVALAVTAGKIFLPDVASSTHYYATYVSPAWARSMERLTKIGQHVFYRTYGGGWS